jgi:hypothetical protein
MSLTNFGRFFIVATTHDKLVRNLISSFATVEWQTNGSIIRKTCEHTNVIGRIKKPIGG